MTLNRLILPNNRLKRLFVNMFSDLHNLTLLQLGSNHISEVESGSFNELSNVDNLNLYGNRLTVLKAGMFHGLAAVLRVSLVANGINAIEDNTFANLKNLKYLSMYYHHLAALRPGMFSGLDSLWQLRLEGNRLTTLPADVFKHLPRSIKLGLGNVRRDPAEDNPLKCDVEICWLKQKEINGTITWYTEYDGCGVVW